MTAADDVDNEIYGTPEERIDIQIAWLKNSNHGNWEYAVWKGDRQLVLGWSNTLDEVMASVKNVLTKHGLPPSATTG